MCNLCHENVREFYFSLNTAVWEVDLHNWNKWNKTKKYPPLCLMQKVLWWPKAVQNRTVIWDLRNKQENAKRWMSFLLIRIIFLLFCFVSNSQCCRCSLSMVVSEKLLPSLSLGRAIRISHSCQCPFWDHGAGGCLLGGTNLRFKAQWEARHSAAGPVQSVGQLCLLSPAPDPPCNNLFQSLQLTWEPCGGAVQTQGRETGHLAAKSAWPCQTGVGNYAFISMSFCLLGICTTHVVSVCFIYL